MSEPDSLDRGVQVAPELRGRDPIPQLMTQADREQALLFARRALGKSITWNEADQLAKYVQIAIGDLVAMERSWKVLADVKAAPPTLCPKCQGTGTNCCPMGHAKECMCVICQWRRNQYSQEKQIEDLREQLETEKGTWRCFHCGFETASPAAAEAHFGERDDAEELTPLCRWWSKLSQEERAQQFQDLQQQLNAERDEAARLISENEGLGHQVSCNEADIASRFKGCRSIQEAFNLYDSMEGRALAAEEREVRFQQYLLDQPWHSRCDIIRDYTCRPTRRKTRPTVQVRYNDGSEHPPFLRYSCGPKQGFFWDVYGEDFQDVQLAVIALSKAPAPVNVGPITFSFPLKQSNPASLADPSMAAAREANPKEGGRDDESR